MFTSTRRRLLLALSLSVTSLPPFPPAPLLAFECVRSASCVDVCAVRVCAQYVLHANTLPQAQAARKHSRAPTRPHEGSIAQ